MEFKTICKGIIDDQVHWTILINCIEFNYSQGLGFVKITSELAKQGLKADERTVLKFNSQEQKEKAMIKALGRQASYNLKMSDTLAVINPKLDDVLYCLFLDSEAHESCFQDWATNFGYDEDSIKAKNIYEACLDNYFKLKKALGKNFETEKQRIDALEL